MAPAPSGSAPNTPASMGSSCTATAASGPVSEPAATATAGASANWSEADAAEPAAVSAGDALRARARASSPGHLGWALILASVRASKPSPGLTRKLKRERLEANHHCSRHVSCPWHQRSMSMPHHLWCDGWAC
eukprot:scaffold5087_cov125-Isochrysis_galbana.AAC.3